MPGTFSPPLTSMETARAVMHIGIANPRWRGKRSRHSRRMCNPQFYVSSKRPMETNLFTTKLLHGQYLVCCCDGYKRSQSISIPGIDLVCPGYSGFRLSMVTYISVCPRLEFTPTIALGLNQQSLYSRMMTSSNVNIFRFTDPLCGEFTGHRWFPTQRPVTRNFGVFLSAPEQTNE